MLTRLCPREAQDACQRKHWVQRKMSGNLETTRGVKVSQACSVVAPSRLTSSQSVSSGARACHKRLLLFKSLICRRKKGSSPCQGLLTCSLLKWHIKKKKICNLPAATDFAFILFKHSFPDNFSKKPSWCISRGSSVKINAGIAQSVSSKLPI